MRTGQCVSLFRMPDWRQRFPAGPHKQPPPALSRRRTLLRTSTTNARGALAAAKIATSKVKVTVITKPETSIQLRSSPTPWPGRSRTAASAPENTPPTVPPETEEGTGWRPGQPPRAAGPPGRRDISHTPRSGKLTSVAGGPPVPGHDGLDVGPRRTGTNDQPAGGVRSGAHARDGTTPSESLSSLDTRHRESGVSWADKALRAARHMPI